ncbi:MotA/TolQ/ExbB proton channel family protein [Lacisediminimonas sp.]|uniref:MotA/TolQ/ExbB proton channel family protein n=1 Tax=Lacisediminimonas sp. TaxID=3060582 RepID=UPI002726B105|nr:MotA/TolQ/ExbB proton channel family protein [Lacisediminimonas sp.]MDO8298479.1 MotA/TolQ/ExbB proton channel family protein [Lacisediminimonas sp.]
MNESLGFAHFLSHTDGVARVVLGLLLIGSVVSWYLVISKGVHIVRMNRRSQRFLKIFWDAPNLEAVASEIRNNGTPEPFSHLLHHGFTALDHLGRRQETSSLVDAGPPDEMLTRALRRSIDEDKSRLEFGQTFLATVASSAPFVGLLGTVWGIYHALMVIGMTGQSSLDKVAGPVGEALIMTGIGLAVAIPAAIAYNSFARATRNTLAKLNSFAYDVHNFLATGIKASPPRDNARATSDKVASLARVQGGAR